MSPFKLPFSNRSPSLSPSSSTPQQEAQSHTQSHLQSQPKSPRASNKAKLQTKESSVVNLPSAKVRSNPLSPLAAIRLSSGGSASSKDLDSGKTIPAESRVVFNTPDTAGNVDKHNTINDNVTTSESRRSSVDPIFAYDAQPQKSQGNGMQTLHDTHSDHLHGKSSLHDTHSDHLHGKSSLHDTHSDHLHGKSSLHDTHSDHLKNGHSRDHLQNGQSSLRDHTSSFHNDHSFDDPSSLHGHAQCDEPTSTISARRSALYPTSPRKKKLKLKKPTTDGFGFDISLDELPLSPQSQPNDYLPSTDVDHYSLAHHNQLSNNSTSEKLSNASETSSSTVGLANSRNDSAACTTNNVDKDTDNDSNTTAETTNRTKTSVPIVVTSPAEENPKKRRTSVITARSDPLFQSNDSDRPAQQQSQAQLLDENQIRSAKHLTSLFLDTRRVLRADLNIVDPLEDTSHADNFNKLEHGTGPSGQGVPANNPVISRGTLIRAERVRSTIGIKYIYLERIYDWAKLNGDVNPHPGVEGVYNPLQVVRNRRIRAKYKEYPKPLTIKTIPLACNRFSSHNNDIIHEDGTRADGKRRNPWRMVWAIDLNEFVNDNSWRTSHWHELKKPNGELWFPPPGSRQDEKSSHEAQKKKKRNTHEPRSGRLHDKLFKETSHSPVRQTSDSSTSSPVTEAERFKSAQQKRRSSSLQSSASDLLPLTKSGFETNGNKQLTLRDKVKVRARKLYGPNVSSSSWSSEDDSDHAAKNSSSDEKGSKFLRKLQGVAPRSAPNLTLLKKTNSNTNDNYKHTFSFLSPGSAPDGTRGPNTFSTSTNEVPPPAAEHINNVPIIRVNTDTTNQAQSHQQPSQTFDESDLDISKVAFRPVESKRNITSDGLDDDDDVATQTNVILNGSGEADSNENKIKNGLIDASANTASEMGTLSPANKNVRDMHLANINTQLQFIDKAVYLKSNYLVNIYPRLITSTDSKLDKILYHDIQDILQSTFSINDDVLPAYETLYNGFLDEIKSLIHMANEVYAVRIDNLLSNSDRSIGEINTSLSLELRKVNEKLDKLNGSLFSNIVTETLRDNDLTINLHESGNRRTLYFCLENLIVVLLRLTWVFVNIYKLFMGILKFFWKILRFFFF